MPQESQEDAPFQYRMQAGEQLGAGIMIDNIIKEINKGKQLVAELEPIDIESWDTAIHAEIEDHWDGVPTPVTSTNLLVAPRRWYKSTHTTKRRQHRPPHKPQKTKVHEQSPHITPSKTTPWPKTKRREQLTAEATSCPPAGKQGAFVLGDQKGKGWGKGGQPKPRHERGLLSYSSCYPPSPLEGTTTWPRHHVDGTGGINAANGTRVWLSPMLAELCRPVELKPTQLVGGPCRVAYQAVIKKVNQLTTRCV